MQSASKQSDDLFSIVFGSINGQFDELFAKLATLQPKHNFAFAIIAGNFFANDDTATQNQQASLRRLLANEIFVPLPVYVHLGQGSLPKSATDKLTDDQAELCANVSVLERSCAIKTAEGLRLVSIAGSYATDSDGKQCSTYTAADVERLSKGSDPCDILITSDWPSSVTKGSRLQYSGGEPPNGTDSIAHLCLQLKPRYHFSVSDAFYEREPFSYEPSEHGEQVTRFISIAPFGNLKKQKAMYAFTIDSAAAMPKAAISDLTQCPFTSASKKRKTTYKDVDAPISYRYSDTHADDHYNNGRNGKRGRHRQPLQPQECYFCLSRDAGRHMITSIGDLLYMTVAKGPLTLAGTFPQLNFACHVLLIPIAHQPTIAAMPEEERRPVLEEMAKYRNGLHEMLIAKSADESGVAQLGSVMWEISRASGVHLHWQFIPIPVHFIHTGLVEAAFIREAENLDYPRFARNAEEVETAEDGDFFKVHIWSQAASKELVLPFDQSFRFDLQFGRRVLARLLDLEKRSNWKTCAQSEAEEVADVEVFRGAFKDYDFSLQ